mmetsp:Transcript_14068/g.42367  ORF Transcript_14068/g.42367 Transcript_14068/m.42367 type:complete len:544 (-) Transcript_14068:77-1708(-)
MRATGDPDISNDIDIDEGIETTVSDEEEEVSGDEDFDPAVRERKKQRSRRYFALKKHQLHASLREELRDLKRFMTAPLVLDRQGGPIEKTTWKSLRQSVLQYGGYLSREAAPAHRVPIASLRLSIYRDLDRYVAYLMFLIEVRRTLPSSSLLHVSHGATVLKFLSRADAFPNKNFDDIREVCFLRQLRKQLKKLAKRYDTRTTSDQLEAMQRWIHWPEVCQVTERLYNHYQLLEEQSLERCIALRDFLVIAIYVHFPPLRCRIFRELEFGVSLYRDDEDDQWYLDLRKFKTFHTQGAKITPLHEELIDPLEEYLSYARPHLLANSRSTIGHEYIFFNTHGNPFSASGWTTLVQNIFERQTGKRISSNLLRSSFITHVYGGEVSDELKRSLANQMNHSVLMAESVYDRRPSLQRRQPALDLSRNLLRQHTNLLPTASLLPTTSHGQDEDIEEQSLHLEQDQDEIVDIGEDYSYGAETIDHDQVDAIPRYASPPEDLPAVSESDTSDDDEDENKNDDEDETATIQTTTRPTRYRQKPLPAGPFKV